MRILPHQKVPEPFIHDCGAHGKGATTDMPTRRIEQLSRLPVDKQAEGSRHSAISQVSRQNDQGGLHIRAECREPLITCRSQIFRS
jgi:hypothetical protein